MCNLAICTMESNKDLLLNLDAKSGLYILYSETNIRFFKCSVFFCSVRSWATVLHAKEPQQFVCKMCLLQVYLYWVNVVVLLQLLVVISFFCKPRHL